MTHASPPMPQLPVAPRVSLVVPVRNEAAHIRECLDALLAHDYPADLLEIIVVDGESDDGTAEIVRSYAERTGRIRLIANPARVMASGLNLGIAASQGDVVGVVSGHSVVRPEYVSIAVAGLRRTGAWAIGGQIVRAADTPWQRAIAAATGNPIAVGGARHNYQHTAGEVEAVFPGMWPRWVFDRVGLFDADMLANEDNEFSHRIRRAAGRVWLDPEIVVEYIPRSSLGAVFHQYRRYGLGKVAVFRKHPDAMRLRHAGPGALVGGGVALGLSALLFPWARALLLMGAAAYAGVLLLAVTRYATGSAGRAAVAVAIATMHVGYGVGTWQGLLRAVVQRGRGRD